MVASRPEEGEEPVGWRSSAGNVAYGIASGIRALPGWCHIDGIDLAFRARRFAGISNSDHMQGIRGSLEVDCTYLAYLFRRDASLDAAHQVTDHSRGIRRNLFSGRAGIWLELDHLDDHPIEDVVSSTSRTDVQAGPGNASRGIYAHTGGLEACHKAYGPAAPDRAGHGRFHGGVSVGFDQSGSAVA